MAFSQRQISIFAPRTLREALGLSFTYRERVRWLLGTSSLLALAFTHVPRDSQIVDARRIADFRQPALGDENQVRFGSFAEEEALRGHPLLERTLFAAASPSLYLAVSRATVEIVSLGQTRTTPIDALWLSPHEAPLAIELHHSDEIYLERRRTVCDGSASHDLLIGASFGVGADGRIGRVRIALCVDGERPVRARLAEHHLEGQRPGGDRLATAARLCAQAIAPDCPRSAAAARSALTLGLLLLKEARVRFDEIARSPTKRGAERR
jgi:CO/xanthine dehydrogenase FAD-binding subunit